MREEAYSSENRLLKVHKNSDQNQVLKANNGRNLSSAVVKVKSNPSWGANIVRGLTADKKAKNHSLALSKKLPFTASDGSNQKATTRVKRSLVGDFPCAANAAQVHPHALECNRMRSSRDLLLELEHLRILRNETKDRESKLQAELLQCRETPIAVDLETKINMMQAENERLTQRISSLEGEKSCLSEQLANFSLAKDGKDNENSAVCRDKEKKRSSLNKLEMEVVELRRVNKELQFEKRDLACKISSAESQLAALSKMTESDLVAKATAEASILRHTNENLCKQVEGLQMSRLTEVEELVYLRWVNSCLRNELQNSDNLRQPSLEVNLAPSPKSFDSKMRNSERDIDHGRSELIWFGCTKKAGPKKEIKEGTINDEDSQFSQCKNNLDKNWLQDPEVISPRTRRHSISGSKICQVELELNRRRQSDGFTCLKDIETEEKVSNVKETQLILAQKYDMGATQSPRFFPNRSETNKITVSDIEKRALRIPNPPPRPSDLVSNLPKCDGPKMAQVTAPPPPPPPPPPKLLTKNTNTMQRAPQVVEFYHSLMKRDCRKDSSGGGVCDTANVANVRSNMIGEIENRSSHLLAIKADVETQGEFVNSLIREVNNAVYRDIEDVVAFVKWLDDELCFLVDERAVLKHFDWPEKKADTLREAAFSYRDLKKLEAEISYFEDDRRLPTDIALKKMVSLSEKMERSVYNILRTRDALIHNCKEFQIPTDWMLDTGIVSKMKFASVKVAKQYMKRVAMELQSKGASDKDLALEYMLLQGVRFAFRIHQFAGGFDSETMHAFEELRNLAHIRNEK